MQQPERTPTPQMAPERAVFLLNTVIDHMVDDDGGHVRETIQTLLDLGFTPEELTGIFSFQASDVEICLGSDGQE